MRRRRGEHVLLEGDISVTVLEMDHCGVKLGICARAGERDALPDERLASIVSKGARYFLFPQGGPRTLVVHCETGMTVSLNGTPRLTALDVAAGDAKSVC